MFEGDYMAGSDGMGLKLFLVMTDLGETQLNAMSFLTNDINHLLFLDEEGEVTAMFRNWSAVMEIKMGRL